MPAKKKPVKNAGAKRVRAVKAAELAMNGASTGEIASALGVSRQTAWRVLNSTETQQIVVMCANIHSDRIFSLFSDSLAVIQDAFHADRPTTITKEGVSIEGGPDHFARLTAVRQLIQLMTAGRPRPKPPEDERPKRGLTLAELAARIGGSGDGRTEGSAAAESLR